jgi:hypothetical protein
MSFVLVLTMITSFGAVTTQQVTGFDSQQSCAAFAVAWADSQRDLNPLVTLRWDCQRER